MDVLAYGVQSEKDMLKPMHINRRVVSKKDVLIDIKYCGVCHSDIHVVRNEWGNSVYPVVPGHEIVGTVEKVGSDVNNFEVGDLVAVGCMVDSCKECDPCKRSLEQYCDNTPTLTYNSPDSHLGGYTYGGYSKKIVVDEHFVLRVSKKLDIKSVAPLLCAGITTYSPLKHWGIKRGDRVGIVGLGGLGHMGIKFANALGAYVVMITTSQGKSKDAKKLGAHEVLLSKNKDEMQKHMDSFDFILNTIPIKHDVNPYLDLLKLDATMVLVGAIEPLDLVDGVRLIRRRKNIAGSLIGGIKETQEMLDFCAKHNITSDVEMINIEEVNKAYERVVKSDVKYRFVIDMSSLT